MRVPWWVNPWREAEAQRLRADFLEDDNREVIFRKQQLQRENERLCQTIDKLKVEPAQLRRGLGLPAAVNGKLSPSTDLNDPEMIREVDNAQANRVAFQQARELNRALRLALGDVVRVARRIVADPTSNSARTEALDVLEAAAKETNVGSQP